MRGFVVFITGRFMLSIALLFVLVFFFLSFYHCDHLAWGRESWLGVCVLLVHLFVYFGRVDFFPFSLPLGVRGWLRLVVVALPGLFYYILCVRYFCRKWEAPFSFELLD